MALRQVARPWLLLRQAQPEMMHANLHRIDPVSSAAKAPVVAGAQEAFPFGMLLLGMLLSGALAWLLLHLVRHLARRRRVLRAARASRAERAAASVLAAQGYAILGRQVRQRWSLLADEREVTFDLVADYLVESGGVRWIAEVKTGERALDLHYGPTRRQMLEYRQAFGVDGVLLVDAETESVRRVRFREPPGMEGALWRSSLRPRLIWLGIGLALGVLLAQSWPTAIASVARSLQPGEAAALRSQCARPPCPPAQGSPRRPDSRQQTPSAGR